MTATRPSKKKARRKQEVHDDFDDDDDDTSRYDDDDYEDDDYDERPRRRRASSDRKPKANRRSSRSEPRRSGKRGARSTSRRGSSTKSRAGMIFLLVMGGIAVLGALGAIVVRPLMFLPVLSVSIVWLTAIWIVHEKAGQNGFFMFIPIYNAIILLEMAGKPAWWFLLMCIPFVNLYVVVALYFGLAKNFGYSGLMGIGLIFVPFVCFPILAFSDAVYDPVA